MDTPPISHVAVVGGGTIGASWAALFLARGLSVTMHDPAPDARAQTLARIHAAWPALAQARLVVPGAAPDKIRFENQLEEALEGVDFVQENAPEREAFKIDLFSRMDAVLPESVLIASSSSGLLMSRLQSGCRFPERCLIGHPFNPPHLIPLVEVVGGERTAPAALERAMTFYRGLGKYPIRLNKEVPGHIANRLQAALWREAVHLVAEDVASVADIDAAVAQGPGLRWALFGPHMTFNLGGGEGGLQHFMDHLLGPMQAWWDDLGDPELTAELQRKLVAGVQSEASGRTIASLATERDQQLSAVLALLQSARPGASTE
ncbi:3-hydroxyacyl-CoA dehydrogenase NAD-binding domain-containing protein [Pseudomonadota bacterium AL_CKDN230030165-1A_HGKHYDSX7]